jgi:hypothetical protein
VVQGAIGNPDLINAAFHDADFQEELATWSR